MIKNFDIPTLVCFKDKGRGISFMETGIGYKDKIIHLYNGSLLEADTDVYDIYPAKNKWEAYVESQETREGIFESNISFYLENNLLEGEESNDA